MGIGTRNPKVYKIIAYICSILVSFGGFTFLISWHLGYSHLLKFPPSVAMLSYASSVNYVLIGLSLFALLTPTRIPFVNIFGSMILLITLWRLSELLLDIKYGFTEIIAPLVPLQEIYTEKMPAITAPFFLLIGLVLTLWTRSVRNSWQSTFTLLVGIIIFLLAATTLLNYAIPIRLSFIWHGVPLNFYSQFLAMIVGAGLISTSIYYDIQIKTQLTYRLPIIVSTIIILFVLLLSWSFALEKAAEVTKIANSKLNEIKTGIKSKLEEDVILLKQLVNIIESDKNHSFSEKKDVTGSYLQTQKELDSILWLSPDMLIRNIVPLDKFQEKLNFLFEVSLSVKNNLKLVIEEKKILLVLNFDQINNSYDLFLMHPVYWDKTFKGFIVFVIKLDDFIKMIINELIDHNFAVEISIKDKKIFGLNDKNPDNFSYWSIHDNLPIENLNFNIKIYPTHQLLDLYINKATTYMVLFGGLSLAIAMGLLIHLWQLSNAKIKEIEKYKEELMIAHEEQREALKSTQVGTWSLDLKSYMITWDDFSHAFLYGLSPEEPKSATCEDFLQRILPKERVQLRNYLKNCIKTRTSFDYTYAVIWPDESIHWLVSKGKFFLDKNGKPEKISGFNWDITQTKRSQTYLEVSEKISKLLSENMPLRKTFENMIEILHFYLNWSVMVVWILDPKSESLQITEITHISKIKIPEFEQATRNIQIPAGMTIASRVWSTYRPIWIKDVTQDLNFSRNNEALREGLKGSFALPILEGTNVIGIIELFKQQPFVDVVDEELHNLITSVGIGIGQYVKRKRAEEISAELAVIVTSSNEGIYSIKIDGTVRSWNVGAERIYGWTAMDIIGKSINVTYPVNRLEEFDTLLKKSLLGHPIEHFETQILRKDGSTIWVEKAITAIKDPEGNIIAFSTIVQDISKQREMVETLKVNEKKFRDFVEATEEWVWSIDSEFKITYTNPIIEKILGYKPEEMIGKEILSLLPEDARKEVEAQLQSSIQVKQGWSKRITTWLHKNGFIRWLESNAHPIFDKDDNVIGFRGADRDITQRKLIEKSKNEFISMVNHELRSPLTSILGALGIMRVDTILPEKFRELNDIAYRNSERLMKIVNDIIDIEKFELGKFEFDIKPIIINKIIDESISASLPMAETFNISIIKEGVFTDDRVLADHNRVIQVIMNLLSNAFKFSPPKSSVFISMQPLDHSVRISIRDQGAGISEEFKSKIFTKFAQADTSDSRAYSGTGLGLNICKNLVEGMKGSISFISKKNEGTIFYFELPRL